MARPLLSFFSDLKPVEEPKCLTFWSSVPGVGNEEPGTEARCPRHCRRADSGGRRGPGFALHMFPLCVLTPLLLPCFAVPLCAHLPRGPTPTVAIASVQPPLRSPQCDRRLRQCRALLILESGRLQLSLAPTTSINLLTSSHAEVAPFQRVWNPDTDNTHRVDEFPESAAADEGIVQVFRVLSVILLRRPFDYWCDWPST